MSTRTLTPTVASPVAAMPPLHRAVLQRTCDCGRHTGGGKCDKCRKSNTLLQRRVGASGSSAPSIAPRVVHDALSSPGQRLDSGAREFFEPRFGRDFSQVRVHADSSAAESARAINALAYTHANDIVFGAGQYAPSSSVGRRLLSHELTHTLHQSGVASGRHAAIEIGEVDTHAEREAESIAAEIEKAPVPIGRLASGAILQRQTDGTKPAVHRTRPEDFGITLAVVDHGATGGKAAATARLNEVFRSLRPDNLAELQKIGITRIEMHIIPYDKKIIELPEFKDLKGTKTPDGRLWDDVRGAGGAQEGSSMRYAVAEEDLPGSRHGHGYAIGLGITGGVAVGAGGAALGVDLGNRLQHGSGPGGLIGGIVGGVLGAGLGAVGGALLGNQLDKSSSNYGHDFLAAHESTHIVEDYALTPDQHRQLEALFQSRKTAGGPWLEPVGYTSSNIHEYFAQCASAYFSKPYEDEYKSTYNPEWLRRNDPGMYALLGEVFGARTPSARNDSVGMPDRAKAAA